MIISNNRYTENISYNGKLNERLYIGDKLYWIRSHDDIVLSYIAQPDGAVDMSTGIGFNLGEPFRENDKIEIQIMSTASYPDNEYWLSNYNQDNIGQAGSGRFNLYNVNLSGSKGLTSQIYSIHNVSGETPYVLKSGPLSKNVVYTISVSNYGNYTLTVNDEVIDAGGHLQSYCFPTTFPAHNFTHLTLLGGNTYGLTTGPGSRFYYLKWWRNGNLYKEIVPILHDWTTICLKDLVSGTYYPNIGGGTPVYKR